MPATICPVSYTKEILAIGYKEGYIAPRGKDVDYRQILQDVLGENHYLIKPKADGVPSDIIPKTVAGLHLGDNLEAMNLECTPPSGH
ncbi:MAG: hypothetical protein ABIG84_02535 [archaeon]